MQQESDQQFQDWIGKQQTTSDILTVAPMEGLAAVLDRENLNHVSGDALPPLWHWLYFLNHARQSEIAEDGHPQRGNFLPPISLPRRMWAGSRLKFIRPLLLGGQVQRSSTIKSVEMKQGRSGSLGFVCVEHGLSDSDGILLHEEQDLVFRDMPTQNDSARQPVKAASNFDFARTITPDPVLLFRYSALTFNSHRIHYDRDYAKEVESYEGLVVHGPLLAIYLLELLGDNYPGANLSNFEFKAVSPVFDTAPFQACGNKVDGEGIAQLWISDSAGNLCMTAQATLNPTR